MMIKVRVIKAILTHNTQIGSEMDPFVVLKLGTNVKHGKTFYEAGDMPEFNEQFDFPYHGHISVLHLIVYDQDTTIDDLVGEVQINLVPILTKPFTQRKWYSLKYLGKKPAGKIMLEFESRTGGLSATQTQRVLNQILQPNLHRIGNQQEIRKTEIHPLHPHHKKSHHHPPERFLKLGNHPQKVFSFRDYSVHQKTNNEKSMKSSTFYNQSHQNSRFTSPNHFEAKRNSRLYAQNIHLSFGKENQIFNSVKNNSYQTLSINNNFQQPKRDSYLKSNINKHTYVLKYRASQRNLNYLNRL